MKPTLEDAPGVIWRLRKAGWEAIWRARADLVARGWRPKNCRLWIGWEMSETDAARVSDAAHRLQDEMLVWGRGGGVVIGGFTGTLKSLIACYQSDPDSTWHKKRFHVRRTHNNMLKRLIDAHGDEELSAIKARLLIAWHKEWTEGGVKLANGHAMVGQLRTLFSFGATILEDADCERLCGVMHKMRFPMGKSRDERLTSEHAQKIRAEAHRMNRPSIALAQALQFDLMLRQKDVIGEWVPINEPGASDVTWEGEKWLRGLRWSEIDKNLILRHVTSKKDKPLEVNLRLAPMVMEEINWWIEFYGEMPASGPMIVHEGTHLPWSDSEFRRKWRRAANEAGVPKSVKNMDSRAGAISEATDAGAELEHVRHAATHSDIAMTQRYSRGAAEKIENVQKLRVAYRNKARTEKP